MQEICTNMQIRKCAKICKIKICICMQTYHMHKYAQNMHKYEKQNMHKYAFSKYAQICVLYAQICIISLNMQKGKNAINRIFEHA